MLRVIMNEQPRKNVPSKKTVAMNLNGGQRVYEAGKYKIDYETRMLEL